eukprot:m.81881 g.81881  ORF g.81881 m.81881 type:complete len:446 (-) comp19511_c0_seq3:58-1395(-)
MVVVVIFLPKLVIACSLWWYGVDFLVKSGTNEQLLLNAVALVFVFDIDDYVADISATDEDRNIMGKLPVRLFANNVGRDEIKLWGASSGQCFATLEGHSDAAADVVVCTDVGVDKIVTASNDSTIKIWDLATGACLLTLEGHTNAVNTIAVTRLKSGQSIVVSGSDDKTVRMWDMASGECIQTLPSFLGQIDKVAVGRHHGKAVVVLCNTEEAPDIWTLVSGEHIESLDVDDMFESTYSLAVHRLQTGSDMILTGQPGSIGVWTMGGNRLAHLDVDLPTEGRKSDDATYNVRFIHGWVHDGTDVIVACGGPFVVVWDATTFEILKRFTAVAEIDFMCLGTRAGEDVLACVLASSNDVITLFDFDSTTVATLEGHSDDVWGVTCATRGGVDLIVSSCSRAGAAFDRSITSLTAIYFAYFFIEGRLVPVATVCLAAWLGQRAQCGDF